MLKKISYYRFELVKGNRIVDAFNLVLPPLTLSYDGKYRDNIQKTFGGTHVDLQGMDNEVIKLTGTVGGRRERSGWSKITANQLSGIEAIKYFRDNIWRYPDNPQYRLTWKDMNVKFYDVDLKEHRWVHIDNVSITRDKSQPFWWNFSISLIDIGEPQKKYTPNKLQQALDNYKKKLQGVIDVAQEISDNILSYVDEAETYLDTALGFSDATVKTASSLLTSVRDTMNTILTIPERVAEQINDTIFELKLLADNISSFVNDDLNFVGEYGEYLRGLFEEVEQNTRTMTRSFESISKQREIESVANKELEYGQSSTAQLVNSTQPITVEGNKSASELALELYGDESMADVIIAANNLDSAFVPAGTVIQAPIYEDQDVIEGNMVISKTQEVLGTDVSLNENGFIGVSSSGDLALVSENLNMSQLIRNILKISIDSLVSDPKFGFDRTILGSGITENVATLVHIKMREAFLRDPRIADITDFEYSIDKTSIYVSGKVILKGNKSKWVPFDSSVSI